MCQAVSCRAIARLRQPHSQLGFGLQLGCLRYLGFFPTDLQQVPKSVVDYVADQLQVEPDDLQSYGKRSSTQRHHQRQIQALLGCRRTELGDLQALEQ